MKNSWSQLMNDLGLGKRGITRQIIDFSVIVFLVALVLAPVPMIFLAEI